MPEIGSTFSSSIKVFVLEENNLYFWGNKTHPTTFIRGRCNKYDQLKGEGEGEEEGEHFISLQK